MASNKIVRLTKVLHFQLRGSPDVFLVAVVLADPRRPQEASDEDLGAERKMLTLKIFGAAFLQILKKILTLKTCGRGGCLSGSGSDYGPKDPGSNLHWLLSHFLFLSISSGNHLMKEIEEESGPAARVLIGKVS